MTTGKDSAIKSIAMLLFQIAIGVLGFVISGQMSHFEWLVNMLLLWLGVTIGIYMGGIPLLFQKSSRLKEPMIRLSTTGLGAFIPVALLVLAGLSLGINNPVYVTWAPVFAFFALTLSLLGFYFPDWRLRLKTSLA